MIKAYNILSFFFIGLGTYHTLFDTCREEFDCLFNGWIAGTWLSLILLNIFVTFYILIKRKKLRKASAVLLAINTGITILYFTIWDVVFPSLYSLRNSGIDAGVNYGLFVWYFIANNLFPFRELKIFEQTYAKNGLRQGSYVNEIKKSSDR